MSKKVIAIGTAIAVALSLAVLAVGDDSAVACDKAAKASAASASGCSKTASAKVASTSSCCAAATTASVASGTCTRSAHATVASSAGCDKGASATAAGSGCTKATLKTASTCNKSASTAGCCAGKNAVAGYTKTGVDKETPEEHAAALKGIVTDLPYRDNKRLVVSGTITCGHCAYQATATCAPLLKTTDGKVYPLAPGNLVVDMRHTKSADGFEVTSRVKVMDGVKYLDVVAFKPL